MRYLSERGLTLVEVLASIVLLSIILTGVLMIIIQTAQINVKSEDIIDATYVAQTEMEKIYAASRNGETKNTWFEKNYDSVMERNTYHKTVSNYIIEVQWEEHEKETSLTRVIVKVYDEMEDERASVQMENHLVWEDGS